jgi:NTE family protein
MGKLVSDPSAVQAASQTTSRKRVGLALSGGAARGLAHVGVLQVLEREGIPVDCIAGTSVGSLVGAAYAAGIRADQLLEMALTVRWRHMARPVWPRSGLVSFARLESYFIRVAGDLTFADLTIPYAALATDLETCQPVILREGRVAPAVHASCAVPGVVAPVQWDGRLLVDGGMVNNLPISVIRDMGADVSIAVNLIVPPADCPTGLLQILGAAVETLIARAADDPATADVHIPLPLHGLGSLLRVSAGMRLVVLGQHAAERALPAIRASLDR